MGTAQKADTVTALYPMNGQGTQPLPYDVIALQQFAAEYAAQTTRVQTASTVAVAKPKHKTRCAHFSQIPHFIRHIGLDGNTISLFGAYTEVIGVGGICYASLEYLAALAGISKTQACLCRKKLFDAGLLILVKRGCKARRESDTVDIAPDLWERNAAYHANLAAVKAAAKDAKIPYENQSNSIWEHKKQNPTDSAKRIDKNTATPTTVPKPVESPIAAPVVVPMPTAVDAEDKQDNRLSEEEYEALLKGLEEATGSRGTALEFIKKHGASACEQQLAWLPHRNPIDPGKLLRTSLALKFPEPPAARDARLAAEKAQREAARREEGKVRRQQEQERTQRLLAAFEEWKAKLTPEHHAVIHAEAQKIAEDMPLYRAARKESIRIRLTEQEKLKIMKQWFERETTNDA